MSAGAPAAVASQRRDPCWPKSGVAEAARHHAPSGGDVWQTYAAGDQARDQNHPAPSDGGRGAARGDSRRIAMKGSISMEGWLLFSNPQFQLRFSYPAPTPQGHAVEKLEDQRDDGVRVHLSSRGSQELYLEVVRFFDLAPQEE